MNINCSKKFYLIQFEAASVKLEIHCIVSVVQIYVKIFAESVAWFCSGMSTLGH